MKGSLKTEAKWYFIGKFCYPQAKEEGGTQDLNYTLTTTNKNLKFLVYLADRNTERAGFQWDVIYPKWKDGTMTDCNEISSYNFLENNVTAGESKGYFPARSYMRPYFWYLVAADCSSASGIDISNYEISFTNPEYGFWEFQLSYDRWSIPQAYIAYFIFYFILLAVHLFGCWRLHLVEAYHPLIKILTVAIGFEFFSCLFQMIHYSIFANNGIGAVGILAIGDLLTMASNLLLMFLCILISKGWAITTNYLTQKNILLIVMGLFSVSFLILFIWDNFARDPASTYYFYESWPGIIVLVLRTMMVGWFLWNLRDTLRLENLPEKRNFYQIFGISYTIWFILLPLFVLILSFFDPWVRFKIVRNLSLIVDIFGLIALAFLLWPSRAQNYFTIRTSAQLLDGKAEDIKYDL